MGEWLDRLNAAALREVHRAIFEAGAIEQTSQILLLDDGDDARRWVDRYPLAVEWMEDDAELPSMSLAWCEWWEDLLIHERQEVRTAILCAYAMDKLKGWDARAEVPSGWVGSGAVREAIRRASWEVGLYELVVSQITEIVRLSRGVDAVVAVRDGKGRGLTAHQVTETLRGEWDEATLTDALGGELESWVRRYNKALAAQVAQRKAQQEARR